MASATSGPNFNLDLLDDTHTNKLRIRKSSAADVIRRGPLVARHSVASAILGIEQHHVTAAMNSCRTPSSFSGHGKGEGIRLKMNSPSIPRSRPSSPGNSSTRRPPSPGVLDPSVMESVKNRVRRVQQARLYLLQRLGPNSFLVGGDSPEHKYRVVIGPQTCSCGRGPYCLHLLFVMLRVFQVPESDSRVYTKELKNYEVESLFHNYQQRRNSRVQVTDVKTHAQPPFQASDVKPVEEELCPICLLEMVDGESLVVCISGCRNKLHHHCMSIWAEECHQQNGSVLCPLCRHPWIDEDRRTPRHNRMGSSKSTGMKKCEQKPVTELMIPPEQMAVASEWMKVFGTEIVHCLYSRDWKCRELALKRLVNTVMASCHMDSEDERQRVLQCCAKILGMVATDPVFKVYLGCVRCLRVLLGCASCYNRRELEELQDLIRPIVRTVLLKCADRNRRTAHLSAEVLIELAKGQAGELAVGRLISKDSDAQLEGLELILDCILEDWSFDAVSPQWLAGRLIVLDHLIQNFPHEFWLQYLPLCPLRDSGYKLHNYNRLMTVVEFAFQALHSAYEVVAKLARHVFVVASSMTAKEQGVFEQVLEMLSGLDPKLQTHLKKRLLQATDVACQTDLQLELALSPRSNVKPEVNFKQKSESECTVPSNKTDDQQSTELVIPLNFVGLRNQTPAADPQDKNMEGVSYLEGRDWRRGQLLGTGAFSSCYQAQDVGTGTLMAVKQVPFCRSSEEEQTVVELGIRKEIVTMSKLRHENVVRILGATKQGSHFNMFVEWMAGGSVAGMLNKYGPLKEEVIVGYTKQILDGLSYLHDNLILHRDLKGANLLVDSTGRHLRIGDFGTAVCLVSQSVVPGELQGQLLGTIAFMAPEVLRGEEYGRSCDIWSVGCCVIEMASTNPPWKESCMSNHLALMYKIASSKDPPTIPDTLSWIVKDLTLQCLHVDSDLRPSAKELLRHGCFSGWRM